MIEYAPWLNSYVYQVMQVFSGNEIADYPHSSTNKILRCLIHKISASNFLTPFKLTRNYAWQSEWASSAANLPTFYRYKTPTIPSHIWFLNLSLYTRHIVQFF